MIVSPIKIQGKKTKIISEIIKLVPKDDFLWIEPFLGSGEVLFNVNPEFALVCDNNIHIINFFNALKNNVITPKTIREYLEKQGQLLSEQGKEFYYKVRNNFNKTHNILDFLFLNRSCFNGVMRFNNKGEFNVPFCNKINRFSKTLITKIVNQVEEVQKLILEKGDNWQFIHCDWACIDKYSNFNIKNRIYYFDPPYIERHSTYIDAWTEEKNNLLFDKITILNDKFILSNWLSNAFRTNHHILNYFNNKKFKIIEIPHFYHVGGREINRKPIIECIVTNKI